MKHELHPSDVILRILSCTLRSDFPERVPSFYATCFLRTKQHMADPNFSDKVFLYMPYSVAYHSAMNCSVPQGRLSWFTLRTKSTKGLLNTKYKQHPHRTLINTTPNVAPCFVTCFCGCDVASIAPAVLLDEKPVETKEAEDWVKHANIMRSLQAASRSRGCGGSVCGMET